MGGAAREQCVESGAVRLHLRPCEDALVFTHCWPHRGAKTGANQRMFVPFRIPSALGTDTRLTQVVVAV